MKNLLMYALLLLVFAILQTVVFPETFHMLGSSFMHGFFSRICIDLFLLMVVYFSFNRDFFHGLIWVIALYFIESGLGLFWKGVQIPTLLLVFFTVQLLKVQFVFNFYASIRMAVFFLCFMDMFLTLSMGADISFWKIIWHDGFYMLISSALHAFFAPYIFEWLTKFDTKTIYRFEKQRTLFSSPIRTL